MRIKPQSSFSNRRINSLYFEVPQQESLVIEGNGLVSFIIAVASLFSFF